MVGKLKISMNPFGEFRLECKRILENVLKKLFPKVLLPKIVLEIPPFPKFGELSSSICFELSKKLKANPLDLADEILKNIDFSGALLIDKIEVAGAGYINFYVSLPKFSALTLESARNLDKEYGFLKVKEPKKVIVEHTSVNPAHPIHIGQARNPILGDSLARLLKTRGHEVFRHYYVDDVGRQTAIMAYGYEKLGMPEPKGKIDHFMGAIYTITNCIVEIQRLKKEVKRAKEAERVEDVRKLQRQLDEWVAIAVELKEKYPELFDRLLEEIAKSADPEAEINRLNKAYETGDEKAKKLVRRVCELCLEGIRQTLERAGIFFDSWDWESDFTWSSQVNDVVKRLERTPYVFYKGGVLEFDAEKVAVDLDLKRVFGLREDYEIPSLTLIRADGTTLYTTRDIAYSIWKFKRAQWVINVVGMEQSLPQLQLRLALCALGFVEYAKNLTHFAYNLVTLPGYKISARRGRYITFDEVLDEAEKRAYKEVSEKSPHLSEEEKRKISKIVGIGAVKYALVGVDPAKPVVFTWDRVVSFEKNSAPYIQYTHARACSILRKASRKEIKPNYGLLSSQLEKNIVLTIARFPEIFVEAADNLKPDLIAEYANTLADKFNSFYNALPVIKAKPQELADARLALTDATRIVLRNALKLIGIEAPERM